MSELEKMNEAMHERLGEIVFKACDARKQCSDERICEQEKNLRLLAAITEIRQMSEFYKPENTTEAEIHEAATEESSSAEATEDTPTTIGCPSLAPANLPSGADGTPAAELTFGGKGVDRGSSVVVAKTPQTVVFDARLSSGRKLSAELEDESTEHQAQAYLYDGEKPVCHILFFNQYQTRRYSFPIVRRALNGLMSKVGHRSRNRSNRKAKSGEVK